MDTTSIDKKIEKNGGKYGLGLGQFIVATYAKTSNHGNLVLKTAFYKLEDTHSTGIGLT